MLLTLATSAFAAYSTDIELLRPTFSHGGLPGIDTPILAPPGTVRVGMLVQYERDPLLLYDGNNEIGAVIHNRLVTDIGLSVDLTKRVSARLVMPGGGQWGSEVPQLEADGVRFGDFGLGMRVQVVDLGAFAAAFRADFLLPLGSADAWWGEHDVRAVGGVLLQGKVGPFRLLADTSVTGRSPVQTGENFKLGSELGITGGAMIDVWPERVSVGANLIHRAGFEKLWKGGAENPAELVAGAQARVSPRWQVDVGVGRGIAEGYGTSQFRAFAGLTFIHEQARDIPPTPAEKKPTQILSADLPEDVLAPETEAPPAPRIDWKRDELARVEETQIIIRDPIQFELATATILAESLPTLHAIAMLLHDHAEIGHIVIEGHASEEGTFEYNYELSVRRSLAIFQQLVLAGVHPSRLSCRGMGETVPVLAGTDEAALAANRRVIFHIVRRIRSDEPIPDLGTEVRLPWNGNPEHVEPAVAPAPPPAPEEDR